MKKYLVKNPLVLRDGIIEFEFEKEKRKTYVDRYAGRLESVKNEENCFKIIGDLHLKAGMQFRYEGNVKPIVGRFLVDIEPELIKEPDLEPIKPDEKNQKTKKPNGK